METLKLLSTKYNTQFKLNKENTRLISNLILSSHQSNKTSLLQNLRTASVSYSLHHSRSKFLRVQNKVYDDYKEDIYIQLHDASLEFYKEAKKR